MLLVFSFAFTDLDKAGASSYLWLELKGEIPKTTQASSFTYVPETRYENLVRDPLSRMLNCGIVWMTLKTPIYLFPVMLNISVESTELPRPRSRAITCWGTKEVIVSLPSRARRLFPSSPYGARAVLFLAFFSLFSATTEPWEACGGGSQWGAAFYPQGYKHYRQLRDYQPPWIDTDNKKSGKYREGFHFL